MRSVRRPVSVLLAVVTIVAAGCSGEPKSRFGARAVVKGKVTLNGQPQARGSVVFVPVDPAKGDEQYGALGANGEYITSVFPGKYKVAVQPEYLKSPGMKGGMNIPNKYWDANASGLEIEIPPAGKDGADFPL
jgi:hypothetical protein